MEPAWQGEGAVLFMWIPKGKERCCSCGSPRVVPGEEQSRHLKLSDSLPQLGGLGVGEGVTCAVYTAFGSVGWFE